MLASDHVENLVSVCSRSLFALRVLRAYGLPDEALHSVTRATTVARLMYAVPSWWGITAEKDRAKIERLYNRLKRMGYLPADAPSIPALVDQAEASESIQINPPESSTCSPPPTTSRLQQYNMRMAYALDRTIMFSQSRTTRTSYPATFIN